MILLHLLRDSKDIEDIKIIRNKKMMRKFQKMLGMAPVEPESILRNRIILKKRQTEALEKAAKLPTDEALLHLPLSELANKKGQQKFGTFVARCNHQFHQDLKFLADINIEQALETNACGIPFTVKDHLKVDGLIETCGFSDNITASYENSEVVSLLIKEGCTPFAHTNVPLGLFNIETGNHVWGKSTNPYKRFFTVGGSSGGEAAAVATKCSAFGLASDTAGSAKIPAAYCGVVGFKPTGSKRLSTKGRVGVSGLQGPSIKDLDTSLGFITRSVDDLAWLNHKTLGKSPKYNPYITGTWNTEKYEKNKTRKMRFGYIVQDHEMKAAPAVRNCINESVELLRENGHQVFEFEFPELYKFRDFIFKVLANTSFLDQINKRLGEENQHEQCKLVHFMSKYGRLGAMLRQLIATNSQEKYANSLFTGGSSTLDLLRAISEKDKIKQKFLKAWHETQIDVLITPVTPFTAPIQASDSYLLTQLTFCGFPNVLEMPSGTVPIRLVKPEQAHYEDLGFYGSKIRNSIIRSEGLPVGIQLSSAFMDDETCVAAMWQLEQLLPKLPPPPTSW